MAGHSATGRRPATLDENRALVGDIEAATAATPATAARPRPGHPSGQDPLEENK
jgi:hypothetical protein